MTLCSHDAVNNSHYQRLRCSLGSSDACYCAQAVSATRDTNVGTSANTGTGQTPRALASLEQLLLDKTPVVLAKYCEPTRLRFDRRMPHVRGVDWF